MEQANIEKITTLVERWGVPLQLILTMEESAELTKLCSKLLRGPVQRPDIVDNLADTYVMLQTMCLIYGVNSQELEAVAGNKLDIGLSKKGWEVLQEEAKGIKEEQPSEEEKKE